MPLAALIHSLLEKDPQRRPASATAVAERLRAMEGDPALWPPSPAPRRSRGARRGFDRRHAAVEQASAGSPDRRAGSGAASHLDAAGGSVRSRRVRGEGSDPAHARRPRGDRAGGTRRAARDCALAPAWARAVAAPEIVLPTIACDGQWCRVSLRREIAGATDTHIVSDSGPFDVPSEPEDSLALARAVDIQVRRCVSDDRPRSPGATLAVRSPIYPRYLATRRRMETGEMIGVRRSTPRRDHAIVARAHRGVRPGGRRARRLLRDRRRAEAILAVGSGTPSRRSGRRVRALPAGARDRAGGRHRGRARRAREARARRHPCLAGARQAPAVRASSRRRPRRSAGWCASGPSWKNFWSIASVEIDLGDAKGARAHLDACSSCHPAIRAG